jgi:hypothetical protein
MDSDFKTPSGEPAKNEDSNETKVPVMDDSSTSDDNQTNEENNSSESDSHESDSSVMHDEEDRSTQPEEESHSEDSMGSTGMSDMDDEPESPKPSEPTESVESVTNPAILPPVKIHGAHKYIYGYVGLIILVAAVVGVYVWQHGKVTSLDTQLAASNSELTTQQQRVYSLESQLSKADSQIASLSPATLQLSFVKGTRYTPSGTNSAKNSGVAIDISITNTTSKAISLVTSTFKIKDAQSNSYGATNFPAQSTDSSLPTGYTLLIDQSLAPNATVSGTLEFGVPTTTLTSFTLVYNSQTLPVTVTAN